MQHHRSLCGRTSRQASDQAFDSLCNIAQRSIPGLSGVVAQRNACLTGCDGKAGHIAQKALSKHCDCP
jgi:hypothetical protein